MRRKRRRRKESSKPVAALLPSEYDRQELKVVIRIVLAVALTAAIVFGVFYFLEKTIYGPPQPRVSVLDRECDPSRICGEKFLP